MKFFYFLPTLAALALMGCQKEKKADATVALEQSFKAAEPEAKRAIATVTTSLKAGNYTEVAKSLDPILSRTNLTEQQKQALGVTLQQLNQAVGSNPALDTKEMYDLRAKISKVLSSGPRF